MPHLLKALPIAVGALLMAACSKPEQQAQGRIWHVDPVHGSDQASGDSPDRAWKTFAKLNQTSLKAGDEVIIAPGQHPLSLVPKAWGKPDLPVVIRFLPGVHAFGVEQATRKAYFISNSCAEPEKPMPIGILVEKCHQLEIVGGGTAGDGKTTLLMTGRMTHFITDRSEAVLYQNLVFDLLRPTVSEFRVTDNGDNWADIHIAEGSTHALRDGRIVWTGDIGEGRMLAQEAIPAEGRARRIGFKNNPLDHASRIEALGPDRYRLHFTGRSPPAAGRQFQLRTLHRDVVGAHHVRSKDIAIRDCEFNAFAGMGIISQFTDGIEYERVKVVPPAGTLRTCPAWADVFHFSGCRGQITVSDCVFSGTQDDAINVHGTHLKIVGKPANHQVRVRFMHPQTYGFAAFEAGDEIVVIHAPTLREHADNPRRRVSAVERIDNHDWLLTLDGSVPHFEDQDVIDNLSWYPDLTVRGCHVEMNSCRGFLVTTRGKVDIDRNVFIRCAMPAILIENDASGWFESGPVRDMAIRNNTFVGCGIEIHPRVKTGNAPVHENIRITDNIFKEGSGIKAHHCAGLVIQNNRSDSGQIPIELDPASTEASVRDNY